MVFLWQHGVGEDEEIEPIGETGMGEASEMPFRCEGAQDGEEAFEFDGAVLFETRDFHFDPGLAFGSLISFAAGPRALSASICSIRGRCSASAAKRESGELGRFRPQRCKRR
jgi:hypothetical protein